jgi:exonuclease SbcC
VRIHRLQLTAFGPFPGTEVVDVDDLSSGGLFLLHGPTGAGKTSVLDAVCFALYGRVPGTRGGSARLRSDHADPTVAAEVACEFTVADRRFEVTRSPAWERPKKRGTGTTTEQTRVTVREREGDGWRVLTTRADEAGHLLDALLGLGLDQFTKLVLLPQGEFAAFLRADAEVRRQMLERLFGADRFTAVQQWMRQHQLDLRREVDTALAGTERLLAQAHQVAAPLDGPEPLPTVDGAGELTGATDPLAPLRGLQRLARQACEEATARRLSSQAALKRASQARERGETLAARRHEHAVAAGRRDALTATAAEQAHRVRRLDLAGLAAGLLPVATTLDAASRHSERARRQLAEALDGARATSPLAASQTRDALVDLAAGEAATAQARTLLAVLAEAERDAARLAELDAELARRTETVARATRDAVLARDRVTALQDLLDDLRGRREAAAVVAVQEPDAAAALAAAQAVLDAAGQRDRLTVARADAEQARDTARRRRDDARESWLDLRERRLAGIAAELAAGLRPGSACPVCGSSEHPAPAEAGDTGPVVDQAGERAAQRRVEAAERDLEATQATLAETSLRLVAAREVAGEVGLDAARARRAAAADRLAGARTAQAELATAERALTEATGQLDDWAARREGAEATLQKESTELASTRNLAADLRARVPEAAVDGQGPGERRRQVERWVAALEETSGARREVEAADAVRADALAEADLAAARAGFPTLTEALTAVADAVTLDALRAAVRRYDDELAAVTDRLADPALVEAAGQPAPSLPALVAAEEHARSDDDAAAARVAVCEGAATALDDLAGRLQRHLRRTSPVLQRYRTAEQLSRCLDGTGGDNSRRMSLSAYVLAARLEQVAQAASERLSAMSGGRYTLVHSDDLERGRVRSGLSLRVVDEWTGAQRETASLSGGEAFYTSLALALGLADVVTAEAGGTAVETLFVDEGFGSLDEETLDEVMDVLDGLRSGGRAVGLVSHVPELRHRIPSRLEVVKTRAGSRLRAASGT